MKKENYAEAEALAKKIEGPKYLEFKSLCTYAEDATHLNDSNAELMDNALIAYKLAKYMKKRKIGKLKIKRKTRSV